MSKPTQTCGTCANFEFSRLEGYGYCKSAPDFVTQARLLAAHTLCAFGAYSPGA